MKVKFKNKEEAKAYMEAEEGVGSFPSGEERIYTNECGYEIKSTHAAIKYMGEREGNRVREKDDPEYTWYAIYPVGGKE